MSVRPKSVVVTGASSGIGQGCALHLERLGWRVFAGVRSEASAAALRSQASARLTPLLLDVTDQAGIAQAVQTVSQALGDVGLDGLINNAGSVVGGPLEFLPIAQLRQQLEVNVIGQIAVTQAFMPLLRAGRGRIVNIGSIAGRSAIPLLGPYAASKHAIEALSDTLRMELLPFGLEVCLIEPGSILTPIWEKSLAASTELSQSLPPQVQSLYGLMIAGTSRFARYAARQGQPVEHVTRAVEHALTAPRPRTRYIVGRDAWIRRGLQFLPDRVRDRLIVGQMQKLGQPRSQSETVEPTQH